MNSKFNWKEISPTCIELEGARAWLKKPLNDNHFLLVSWRMSGSEFTKSFIYENYNTIADDNVWGKAHAVLDIFTAEALINAGTKVIVVITDPREVAANLLFFDNGLHHYNLDYKTNKNKSTNSVDFLNEVASKQIQLINYYTNTFKDNCIVVRYEDTLFFQDGFHSKISKFLNLVPLNIDGASKYRNSMYKNVGHFKWFFPNSIIKKHYNKYKDFYEKWNYPYDGLAQLKYKWCVDEIL